MAELKVLAAASSRSRLQIQSFHVAETVKSFKSRENVVQLQRADAFSLPVCFGFWGGFLGRGLIIGSGYVKEKHDAASEESMSQSARRSEVKGPGHG